MSSLQHGDLTLQCHIGFHCSGCGKEITWPPMLGPSRVFARETHIREASAKGWTFYASRYFQAYCPSCEPTRRSRAYRIHADKAPAQFEQPGGTW